MNPIDTIIADIVNHIIDNTTGAINPQILRQVLIDLVGFANSALITSVYRGAYASDAAALASLPSGTTPYEGLLYFNTTTARFRVYHGATFADYDAEAQALLAAFNSSFIGTFSADPTVDGNGNPLGPGDFYYSTVSNKFRVFNGTTWADYDATAQTALTAANSAATAAAAARDALYANLLNAGALAYATWAALAADTTPANLTSGKQAVVPYTDTGSHTDPVLTASYVVTISIASPGVVTYPSHGLLANAPVVFTTTGALPTGLTAGTTYYVKTVIDANNFTLSATAGGTAINTSGTQSGTHTATANITVLNAGAFRYSTSPAGWTRFADYNKGFVVSPRVAFAESTVDSLGYIAEPTVLRSGYPTSFSLRDCDTIVHYGDSLTDATYVLRYKCWVSILSNFSPYRHVDQGMSGNQASDIYDRIRTNRLDQLVGAAHSYTYDFNGGTAYANKSARYVVFMDWGNDLAKNSNDPTTFLLNAQKIIEMVRANGSEPAIVTEHFPYVYGTGATQILQGQRNTICAYNLAQANNIDIIDVQKRANELGLNNAALWEGTFFFGLHPSTRSGQIYVDVFLRWLKTLPKPRRSIKLYNLRATITVGTLADLVFTSIYDLVKRFKEIDVGHRYWADPELFEQKSTNANQVTQFTYGVDHYNALQTGAVETLTDYALLRVALPTEARSLRGVGIELGTDATEVYLLDRFALNTVSTTTLNAAWTQVPYTNRFIRIDAPTLARVMDGNELYVLLHRTGGVHTNAPVIHYSAIDTLPVQRLVRTYKPTSGTELLTKRDCASFSDTHGTWATYGSPLLRAPGGTGTVPFDLTMATITDPYQSAGITSGVTHPITGVIEVTSTDKIGQSIPAVPAGQEMYTEFRVRVWARYWPKAYLDNSQPGFGFPADQVVDKSTGGKTFAVDSPINYETFDFRMLVCEWSTATAAGAPDGFSVQSQMAGPYWTEVDFHFATQSGYLPNYVNFRLSCADGTLQIGKVSMMQVTRWEHRV